MFKLLLLGRGAVPDHLQVTPQFAEAPTLDINSARYLHIKDYCSHTLELLSGFPVRTSTVSILRKWLSIVIRGE